MRGSRDGRKGGTCEVPAVFFLKGFSVIADIEAIRHEKSRLSAREAELSRPLLHDLSLVGKVFRLFREAERACGTAGRVRGAESKQTFIFIVLFLYSPSSLAGGQIRRGLRDKIAETIGNSVTLVSHYKDTMFRYRHYKLYRENVDAIFCHVVSGLRGEGHLPPDGSQLPEL